MNLDRCNNIMDLRKRAMRRLPSPVFHYLDGGADDELALARSTRAFDDYELLPTQLSDVSDVGLKTTLFGREIGWPVFLAPTGASKLFHRDGEHAAARAADAFNTVYSLSTLGTATIEEIATVGSCPKLFQIYVFKDRGLTNSFVERCREARYDALCLTVDTPVAGNRERDLVYGLSMPPRLGARTVLSWARHLNWVIRVLTRNDLAMVNIKGAGVEAKDISRGIMDYVNSQLDRSLTWKDVEWLRSQWDGPLVVKGVLTVEDCRKAADAGATAVMLSNHGGRQLESAPAPVDCIAAVADALRDRLEIICDGGIRRGNHVVKALANGANACSIGRAYLYGLAAAGCDGVERALTILKSETERTMALLGCNSVAKLGRGHLRR